MYYLFITLAAIGVYWFFAVMVLSLMGLVESYNTVSRCNNWMLYVYCSVNLAFIFVWIVSMATGSESLGSFVFAMVVMGMAYVYVTIMHEECFDTGLVEIAFVQIFTEIGCLCARFIYDRYLKHRFFDDENEEYRGEAFLGL